MNGRSGEVAIGDQVMELPDPHHTIRIGDGCHLVADIQSWDIVFAAAPDTDGGLTSLRLSKNGEVRFNGELIGKDEAMGPIVEVMRRVFTQMFEAHCAEDPCKDLRSRPSPLKGESP